ncbi:MAG: hypothetical protein ABF959_12560 [Gluconobacter albidus]
MKKTCTVAVFILLAACASHAPLDMTSASGDDDDPAYTVKSDHTHGGGGMGGNGNIWGEVFRTALQTGMGFVHH